MTYRDAAKSYNLSHGSIAAIVKQYKHEGAKSKRNERLSKYKQEVDEYRQHSRMMKKESSSVITSVKTKKDRQV